MSTDSLTVGTLIKLLQGQSPEKPIVFGGSPNGLNFHRVKNRGDFVQIEFSQNVYRLPTGELVVEEFDHDQP